MAARPASSAPRSGPADDHVTEKVPVDLANAFLTMHGADVSGVPVRRGRTVARSAARRDAAAFSRDGIVYLPDSAGSLGQATARALLAHELTHVVQQRMLGSALPAETSAQGAELEEQARATQRRFLGAAGAVPILGALAGSGAEGRAHAPGMRHRQPVRIAGGQTTTIPRDPSPASPAVEPGVQRQPVVATASSMPVAAQPMSAASAPTVLASPGGTAEEGGAAPGAAVADMRAAIGELRERLGELADRRRVDLDDPVELDELAARLYGRLRSELRLELLVDRERAGLLTDFR
jgi:Domain of unknown function (DUF4157)